MPNFPPPNYTFLWDDDAESGDSLCLVLREREAAAAYSHDLAGEGETDSASFRLRGEERDENVGGYIFVEKGAVVRMELNEACSSGCGTFIQTVPKFYRSAWRYSFR